MTVATYAGSTGSNERRDAVQRLRHARADVVYVPSEPLQLLLGFHRMTTSFTWTQDLMEHPFDTFLDWLVEHEWSASRVSIVIAVTLTFTHNAGTAANPRPIGAHVLMFLFAAFLNAFPEYFTMECIVNAGRPIDAIDWKMAL